MGYTQNIYKEGSKICKYVNVRRSDGIENIHNAKTDRHTYFDENLHVIK